MTAHTHFTGTMDHWDPLVTDGFAKNCEVIPFDNAGISSSSGDVPTSVEGMAANAITARRTNIRNGLSGTSRCSCPRQGG